MEYSYIANSGIQLITFPVEIDTQDIFKKWFREWYDKELGLYHLDVLECVDDEGRSLFFNQKDLFDNGYLAKGIKKLDAEQIERDGFIKPVAIDYGTGELSEEIYKMSFSDTSNKFGSLINQWLPVPYFKLRTPDVFEMGPFNWVRCKFIPTGEADGKTKFNVILAIDTHVDYNAGRYTESPVFSDKFQSEIEFEVCSNDILLTQYCSASNEKCSYIDDYLRRLVHPGVRTVGAIRNEKHRMSYISSYFYLMSYVAQKKKFPKIKLLRDNDVELKNVDMIVDIGNSRTTALLVEGPRRQDFKAIDRLKLQDYTRLITDGDNPQLLQYEGAFDMRVAFRKVDFGDCGIEETKQFIYPSLLRLGTEANYLIHATVENELSSDTLSTYSSPKRYLWDGKKNKQEWEYLVLKDERRQHILELKGITDYLTEDGRVDLDHGGGTHYYSRRSLMTFSFLEMLAQARCQINSPEYRNYHGKVNMPRRIRRIMITCPTTMSKTERFALVNCARDAQKLISNFYGETEPVEIVPLYKNRNDDEPVWYYDEATCSQLVYMYAEVGYKYKGNCDEFFKLYGKEKDGKPCLTVGSLDIGAGTSDLMICDYSYNKSPVTTLIPDPVFYDSFYYAGDDMLKALIQGIIIEGENSAIRKNLPDMPAEEFRQLMKDFFGHDYAELSMHNRIMRRDFNLQVSVPLMYYFLQLLADGSADCTVHYKDVWEGNEPNEMVLQRFEEHFGLDLRKMEWNYVADEVAQVVNHSFDGLLKKVAAIMFAYHCDIVILSGRPTALKPIRNIFLKYYAVAPDRLISLTDYYAGDWYPSRNTGYIRDTKTVVVLGAAIAYYATDGSMFENFVLDTSLMARKLKSVVNYVATPPLNTEKYVVQPNKNNGEIVIKALPTYLNVKQVDIDAYPERQLYSIDFNYDLMMEAIRRRMEDDGLDVIDAAVVGKLNEDCDRLRHRMPFRVTIERDPNDRENLEISSITDVDGNDIPTRDIEITIQSLGTNDCYWLDSGEFNF